MCTSENLAEPFRPNRALALPPLVRARGLIPARAPPAQAEAEVLYKGGRVIKPHPMDRANCPGLHGLVASFAEGAGLRCDRCTEEVRVARGAFSEGGGSQATRTGGRAALCAGRSEGRLAHAVSPNISIGESISAVLWCGR